MPMPTLSQFGRLLRTAQVTGPAYLASMQRFERNHGLLESATDARLRRQSTLQQLRSLARPSRGQHLYGSDYASPGSMVVAVIVWSRDCDCAEGTNRYFIHANAAYYDWFVDRMLSGAEGPMSFSLANPDAQFRPSFRDRALEAFENGHPYSV